MWALRGVVRTGATAAARVGGRALRPGAAAAAADAAPARTVATLRQMAVAAASYLPPSVKSATSATRAAARTAVAARAPSTPSSAAPLLRSLVAQWRAADISGVVKSVRRLMQDPHQAEQTKTHIIKLISKGRREVAWTHIDEFAKFLLRHHGRSMSTKEYNIILRAVTRASRFNAFHVLEQMEKSSAAKPDLRTYAALIQAVKLMAQVCKTPRRKRMPQPSGGWVGGGRRNADPELVVPAMLGEKVVEYVQKGVEHLREREAREGRAPALARDSQAFHNTAIDALADCHAPGAALHVFDELEELGIERNQFTFNSALKAARWMPDKYLRAKRVGALLEEMARTGVEPSPHTFTLGLLGSEGSVKLAEWVFAHMSQKIAPTTIHYTALLMTCAESGRYDKLEPILWQMDDAGECPDLATYRYLVGFCREHRHLELGYKTFKHFIGSNVRDPTFYVTRTVMEMFRDVYEDAMLLRVFKRLGPRARQRIEVAEFAVEAYGRVDLWKEADELTAELRDAYARSRNEQAKEKIARWREIIEARGT